MLAFIGLSIILYMHPFRDRTIYAYLRLQYGLRMSSRVMREYKHVYMHQMTNDIASGTVDR